MTARLATSPISDSIRPFTAEDCAAAADLIARAMNPEESAYAQRTFAQYFDSRAHGIDDGRELFVLEEGGQVVGMTGLHHYNWGPEEIVWLSWFAVDPAKHGRGLGSLLMAATLRIAADRGYSRLLVETYTSDTFAQARAFYAKKGFRQIGSIQGYMPDGADMVVLSRDLVPLEAAVVA